MLARQLLNSINVPILKNGFYQTNFHFVLKGFHRASIMHDLLKVTLSGCNCLLGKFLSPSIKCRKDLTTPYGQASYRIYLVLGIFRWNVSRFCMLLELGMQVSIIQNPLSFHQKSVNSVCCLFYGLIKLYTEITYIWKMWPKIVKKCMSANSVCCLFILSNKHHTETT